MSGSSGGTTDEPDTVGTGHLLKCSLVKTVVEAVAYRLNALRDQLANLSGKAAIRPLVSASAIIIMCFSASP